MKVLVLEDDFELILITSDRPELNFLPLHRSSLEVRVQLLHLGLITSTL